MKTFQRGISHINGKFALVLFNGQLNRAGGIEHVACDVLYALNKARIPVILVCTAIPDLEFVEKYFGRRIRYDRLYSLPLPIRAFGLFFERVLVEGFLPLLLVPISCILQKHSLVTVELDPFFPSYLRRTMSLHTNVLYLSVPKPVYTHSGVLEGVVDRLWWKLWRPVGDNYVAHSCTTKKALFRAGARAPCILYPPVGEDWFAFSNGRKNQFVSFGRISPEKEFDTCIRAFARLKSSMTTRLIIAGYTRRRNPYLKRLCKLSKDLRVEHDVVFQTNPSAAAMRVSAVQSKAHVSCQTEPESFNITVLESMAAGCIPIVPTALFKELKLEGIGFTYSNESELAQAMEHVLGLSDSKFLELSERARYRASQFRQDKFENAFLSLLNRDFTEAAAGRVKRSEWPLLYPSGY